MKLDKVDSSGVGLGRRLGALGYDVLLLLALWFAATAIAMAALGGQVQSDSLAFRLYLLLVAYVFFVGFWTYGGQTLGMRAWKIRVQRANGDPLSWAQASVRFLTALATLGVGLLWCLRDRDRRSLYDILAHTRVGSVTRRYVPPV